MDPYKILGVPMDAQLPEIRTAHRKLVLKCHPDKVADPALKAQKQDEFQKVQQAYEILIDEDARERNDDLLQLHATRERVQQNKANSSAPRSSPAMYREFEIRTAEPPRSRSYREPSSRDVPPSFVPPNVKIFSYTARGSSRDPERGPRYHEDGRPTRRGESYSEKPSKRESERESQRDRDKREEKERRREKDRRKLEKEREREDEIRREKAAKKEAKRQREKQEAKEKKREKEDKRRERDGGAYIETSDDEILHKKSSRKYDTRERSSGRDEPPPSIRRSQTDGPQMASSSAKINNARAYIHRAQTSGPPDRSNSYHPRDPQPPAAPTPPPAPSGAFVAPEEDDVRRSSARPRRGSSDIPPSMPRERNMHRTSREPVEEDPIIINASPASKYARYTTAPLSESPPPRGPVRTNTMPVNEKPTRGMPGPRRAQTYSEGPEVAGNRGRGRSKMYAQAEVLSETEDDYEEPPRRSKHRSRKDRSPARGQEIRYHVGGDGRTKLHSSSSYSRSLPQKQPAYAHYDYDYEPARSPQTSRPDPTRGPSYSGVNFGKVRQGRSYNAHDVAYSHFDPPTHGHYAEERSVYA